MKNSSFRGGGFYSSKRKKYMNTSKCLPWVPEPQNLNERKLVRGKERRKKGGSGQMITQPRFGADQRDYESIRSPFEE